MSNKTWVRVVNRPTLPLTIHMMVNGHKNLVNVLGDQVKLGWKFESEKNKTEVFFTSEMLGSIVNIIKKELTVNSRFLNEFLEMGMQVTDNLVLTSRQASAGNLSGLANDQLAESFKRYVDAFLQYDLFLVAPFPIENYLTEKIRGEIKKSNPELNEENVDERFRELSVPQRESDAFLERKELLELAILKEKGLDIEEKLKEHSERFGHLGLTNKFFSRPWGSEYFKAIIDGLDNPSDGLGSLLRNRKDELERCEKSMKSLNPELARDAELLQGYMFFRSYRIESMRKAQWNLQPLLTEICKRIGVKEEDMPYFIWPEVIESLKSGKMPDIEPRKRSFNVSIVDGKYSISTDEIVSKINAGGVSLKGNIACKGTASGRVRIISDEGDIKKMVKGDILVTTMTTPDLMMAIERAGAIVTDEGGILCHAAIVSREFGIPCITGTQTATKVLKDGDMVRVDAINGIVEKISEDNQN